MAYAFTNTGALPYAAGGVDHAAAGDIMTLFATEVAEELYARLVVANICNRKYEGMFSKQGDKVIIPTLPDITISDHYVGEDIEYDDPSPTPIEMAIDNAKKFAFNIHDATRIQSHLDLMSLWGTHSSHKLKESIDETVLQDLPSDAGPLNCGLTAGAMGLYNLGTIEAPVAITKTNALSMLLKWNSCLTEANVPDEGRWAVIPPWFQALLLESDIAKVYVTGDLKSPLRGNWIGAVGSPPLNLHISNQLLTGAATVGSATVQSSYIVFGWKNGFTFATQASEVKKVTRDKKFAEAMRGLEIFGWKVTHPETLGCSVCYYSES